MLRTILAETKFIQLEWLGRRRLICIALKLPGVVNFAFLARLFKIFHLVFSDSLASSTCWIDFLDLFVNA